VLLSLAAAKAPARRAARMLGRCEMSGAEVLHICLCYRSSAQMRAAGARTRCSLSGKRILIDEAELSAVTGNPVARSLLKPVP